MKNPLLNFALALSLSLVGCTQSNLVLLEERPVPGQEENNGHSIPAGAKTFDDFRKAFRPLALPLTIPALDSGWVQNRIALPAGLAAQFYDDDPTAKYYALGIYTSGTQEAYLIRKTVRQPQYYAKIFLATFNANNELIEDELVGGYEFTDFGNVPALIQNQVADGYTESYKTWHSTLQPDLSTHVTVAYDFLNTETNESQSVIKDEYTLVLKPNGLLERQ